MPVIIRKLIQSERPLTIAEGAPLLGVSPDTLRRAAKARQIATVRFGPRGHFRIPPSEIRRLLGEQSA